MDCVRDSEMLEVLPRALGYLPRRTADNEWAQPKREKCITVSKDGGVGPSDMELPSSEFTLLDFGFPLVQYFPTIPPFLPFGMVMHILCHWRLELCDLPFDFTRGYS